MNSKAQTGAISPPPPLIVAHRGASAEAPENTLAAFELAWKQGAGAVEGDFRLSADGEIVCIHDPDTARVAGKRLVVAESTLPELQRLDVGSWKGERWKGSRIPTLGEVLQVLPGGKPLLIELKTGPEIVHPLAEVLRAAPVTEEQIVLISFNEEVVRSARRLLPGVTVNWLTKVGVNPTGNRRPSVAEVVTVLRRTGAHGVGLGAHWTITRGYVRVIREAGFAVHVWTVDRPRSARRYARMGVASITSNCPARLLPAVNP